MGADSTGEEAALVGNIDVDNCAFLRRIQFRGLIVHAEHDSYFRFEGVAIDGLQHFLSVHIGTVIDGLALRVLSEFNEKGRSGGDFRGIGINRDLFSQGPEAFFVQNLHIRCRAEPAEQREVSEEGMEEILPRGVEIVPLEQGQPVLLCFLHRKYLNYVPKTRKPFKFRIIH
jgi:hypothetical protein